MHLSFLTLKELLLGDVRNSIGVSVVILVCIIVLFD